VVGTVPLVKGAGGRWEGSRMGPTDPAVINPAPDTAPVAADRQRPPGPAPAKDMVWVPGGRFLMGSEDFYPEERPVHRVQVDGFWMDAHPVPNAESRRFVKATGHVTVAERPPEAADYPDADPELLVPGALVFQPSSGPVDLGDWRAWWAWVPGASWRHPEGPGSAPTSSWPGCGRARSAAR
jgi:formylglycine-generating enzyme